MPLGYSVSRCMQSVVCVCENSTQGRIQKAQLGARVGVEFGKGVEAQKAMLSRPRRRRSRLEGVGDRDGVAFPKQLGGLGPLGKRRELPQRGPGRSPGRNRISVFSIQSKCHRMSFVEMFVVVKSYQDVC